MAHEVDEMAKQPLKDVFEMDGIKAIATMRWTKETLFVVVQVFEGGEHVDDEHLKEVHPYQMWVASIGGKASAQGKTLVLHVPYDGVIYIRNKKGVAAALKEESDNKAITFACALKLANALFRIRKGEPMELEKEE